MALKSYEPARYRILVYGLLDAHWSERLANMTLTHLAVGKEGVTVLAGELADQSELLGVLNTLHLLGLPLLKLDCLSAGAPGIADQDDTNYTRGAK